MESTPPALGRDASGPSRYVGTESAWLCHD
uniref:Uncharacterized protein n=1 Tax=Arundo donax TaxID=35708 RepID=A0A0A9A563_ARUDO